MQSLCYIPPSRLKAHWSELEPLVARAVGKIGVFTPAEVLKFAERGEWQIWALWADAGPSIVCLTDIVQYPDGRKVLRVNNLGGSDLQGALPCMKNIQEWGNRLGCHKTTADARPGVARLLRRAGWKQTAVTMEIENG